MKSLENKSGCQIVEKMLDKDEKHGERDVYLTLL